MHAFPCAVQEVKRVIAVCVSVHHMQAERLSTINAWALLNMIVRLALGFGLPNIAMYMGIFLPYSR